MSDNDEQIQQLYQTLRNELGEIAEALGLGDTFVFISVEHPTVGHLRLGPVLAANLTPEDAVSATIMGLHLLRFGQKVLTVEDPDGDHGEEVN